VHHFLPSATSEIKEKRGTCTQEWAFEENSDSYFRAHLLSGVSELVAIENSVARVIAQPARAGSHIYSAENERENFPRERGTLGKEGILRKFDGDNGKARFGRGMLAKRGVE